MTSAAKPASIDASTRYMPLRDAACLIGRTYPDWRDSDIDRLLLSREEADNVEAWDRAAHAEEQLQAWILQGILPAYDLNEHGRHAPLEHRWLETPYFEVCARTSRFLVFPDEWAPLTVDGPALQEKLTGIRRSLPRKRQTYEWRSVINMGWQIALEMEPPRTQAALIARLDQWFIDSSQDGKSGLGEKEMKQLARDILGFLGQRRLSGEVSAPASAPDPDPPIT